MSELFEQDQRNLLKISFMVLYSNIKLRKKSLLLNLKAMTLDGQKQRWVVTPLQGHLKFT